MLRDSAQLAEQANSIPHINSLDFVMESLALGHTVMEHRCGGGEDELRPALSRSGRAAAWTASRPDI
jgi:hypothetical protein